MPHPKLPNDPRDAAAYWFARVHSGNFSVVERRSFTQWRQADGRHEHEYRALETIWQATQMIPAADLRALLNAPDSKVSSSGMTRRRLLVGGAAVCSTVVGGLVATDYWTMPPVHQAHYATGRGELHAATLPDGSRLHINTDTVAVVQYFRWRRAVDLISGEIMLQTTADAQRPFIVNTAIGKVLADAAHFNVRHEDGQLRLAVESGNAEISTGSWWRTDRASLSAGTTTSIQDGMLAAPSRIDVEAATAWRFGKLVFNDQPLHYIVHEISRYLPQPIRITDSRINQLRMGGVFNLKDSAAFLNALRRVAPVKVTRRPDGGVDIAQAV